MQKNNKSFTLPLKIYQHAVLFAFENSLDLYYILSLKLAWWYFLLSYFYDSDTGGTILENEGDIVAPPVIDFYDQFRDAKAIKEIRDVEAREFGQVDASTHRDLTRYEAEAGEFLQMTDGPQAHPILQKEAYFSGIDDIRNNPVYANNTEAELRYKEQQLRNEKKLQHQKSLDNTRRFNPSPFGG